MRDTLRHFKKDKCLKIFRELIFTLILIEVDLSVYIEKYVIISLLIPIFLCKILIITIYELFEFYDVFWRFFMQPHTIKMTLSSACLNDQIIVIIISPSNNNNYSIKIMFA